VLPTGTPLFITIYPDQVYSYGEQKQDLGDFKKITQISICYGGDFDNKIIINSSTFLNT
jgi:hypothetical protein